LRVAAAWAPEAQRVEVSIDSSGIVLDWLPGAKRSSRFLPGGSGRVGFLGQSGGIVTPGRRDVRRARFPESSSSASLPAARGGGERENAWETVGHEGRLRPRIPIPGVWARAGSQTPERRRGQPNGTIEPKETTSHGAQKRRVEGLRHFPGCGLKLPGACGRPNGRTDAEDRAGGRRRGRKCGRRHPCPNPGPTLVKRGMAATDTKGTPPLSIPQKSHEFPGAGSSAAPTRNTPPLDSVRGGLKTLHFSAASPFLCRQHILTRPE